MGSEAFTHKSVKGYKFIIKLLDRGAVAVFCDPARHFAEVARVALPEDLKDDPRGRDVLFDKVSRQILQSYKLQHKLRLYGIEMLSRSLLSGDELAAGVGLSGALARSGFDAGAEPPPPPKGKAPRPALKGKRRLRPAP